MQAARIGAYGGTFDPIHSGHVEVAAAVLDKFELDELLIIPAASPPHKDPRNLSSSYHRFAMAALATLAIPGVRVSALEIESPANPYTFETVARLRALYGPRALLYFIVGSDSFEEMHTWRRPDLILSNCNLVVAARPGYGMANHRLAGFLPLTTESGPTHEEASERSPSAAPGQSVKIIDLTGAPRERIEPRENQPAGLIFLTDYVMADVSSTEIRRRAASNLDLQGMVPQQVADYIHRYDLYKAGRPAEIQ